MQNVGVGFLVIDTWAKWDFEIWQFLWFMEVKVVNLGPIDFQLGYPLISMKMMGKTHFKSISQKKNDLTFDNIKMISSARRIECVKS